VGHDWLLSRDGAFHRNWTQNLATLRRALTASPRCGGVCTDFRSNGFGKYSPETSIFMRRTDGGASAREMKDQEIAVDMIEKSQFPRLEKISRRTPPRTSARIAQRVHFMRSAQKYSPITTD
jgi:hypothetical protein